MGEQCVVLEHHANAALVRRDIVEFRAAEQYLTLGRCFETRQHHQAGCFPGTGRAQHGQELAVLDIQVEVFDDKNLTVIGLLNVLKLNERLVAVCH